MNGSNPHEEVGWKDSSIDNYSNKHKYYSK